MEGMQLMPATHPYGSASRCHDSVMRGFIIIESQASSSSEPSSDVSQVKLCKNRFYQHFPAQKPSRALYTQENVWTPQSSQYLMPGLNLIFQTCTPTGPWPLSSHHPSDTYFDFTFHIQLLGIQVVSNYLLKLFLHWQPSVWMFMSVIKDPEGCGLTKGKVFTETPAWPHGSWETPHRGKVS